MRMLHTPYATGQCAAINIMNDNALWCLKLYVMMGINLFCNIQIHVSNTIEFMLIHTNTQNISYVKTLVPIYLFIYLCIREG